MKASSRQGRAVVRALVLWADDSSPNLGVRALGRGTEALLRRVWPDVEVTFQNYGHRSPHLPFGLLRSLLRERVTGRLGMQKWFSSFDLAIDTRSGDSFADIYGLHRHAIMSAVAMCADQAGVPIVFGPQTVGPFETRRGRLLARLSLKRAKLVMARDERSALEAKRLGRAVDLLTTDVVFAIEVPRVSKSRDVVLNISGLLWNRNSHVDYRAYRRTVRRLYDQLMVRNREVTLLAHVLDSGNVDNDVPAIQDFAKSLPRDVEVVVPSGLDEVREIVASARVVFGSRMHACLNALSVGTPAIPLAYSRKFEPLLQDLGWVHTVDLRNDADPVESALRHLDDPELSNDVPALLRRAHSSLTRAEHSLREVL